MKTKRALFFALLFVQINSCFSQWHQLPTLVKPQLPWNPPSYMFPRYVWPVANGKVLFSSYLNISPSGGSNASLYRSRNDFGSYDEVAYTSISASPWANIYGVNAFNDSVCCYLNNTSWWPQINFTFNDFKSKKSMGVGYLYNNNFTITAPIILSNCITPKFVYFTAGPNNLTSLDTLYFIKTDTTLIKKVTSLPKYSCSSTTKTKMAFLNDSVGLLLTVCKSNLQKSVLIKTTNYGQTWNELMIDSLSQINDFSFPSNNIGYLIKLNGSIHKTINGGLSWSQLSSPTTNSINCIKFADDTLGYIAGNAGQLWKTTDGGINWLSEVSTTTNNINALYTFSNVAYFVDGANNVYKNQPDVVGLKEFELINSQIKIFPNPTSNNAILSIDLNSNSILDISVLNSIGQILKTQKTQGQTGKNNIAIDLSGLSSGVYFATIKVGDAVSTKKIVIQ